MSRVVTGRVRSTSRVPIFRSSDHWRMVMAATSRISSRGSHSKSGRTSAMLRAKKAEVPKKLKSAEKRKIPRKITATGDWK